MIKNKHGDLPVTILVIGVFAVCSFALFSFLMSSINVGNSFVGVDLMENATSQINEYNFYKSLGVTEDKLKNVFDIKDKKLIVKKTEKKFTSLGDVFDSGKWRREVLLFSVEYKLP